MSLRSMLFKGDPKLDECLVRDSAHLTLGVVGEHVSKVQQAVLALDQAGIKNGELAAMRYGSSTATAVLAYKQSRNIVNRSYQDKADDIVGKMTIAALDQELVERPVSDPLTGSEERARITQLLSRERLGAFRMIQTVLKSLSEVQAAFTLADINPESAGGLLFLNRFTIDGLDRLFAVNQTNHAVFLPRIIANFERYLQVFPRLSVDQRPADYRFLLQHALFLKDGKITGDTPDGFSSDNPRGMFFTPRYRDFVPAMPSVFRGLFREALQGIQIHEMGHFYFNFDDGSPRGEGPEKCMRLAVSYDLLARQATFRHFAS